ncbi:Retrotransposable element SLACS protein [Nymphon striatum]|nr:Retrotransposable element SLACS protein [Nymphon striatum]
MATQSKWLRSLTQADQLDKARLLAAASPKSGSWLEVLPVPNLGTRLDDEAFRIGIGLRIGTALCQPHKCRCGSTVDARGLHPLSCKYSEGRFPRHGAINDIVKHALGVAGFPSQLEPVELDRGDGKRPDGLTTFSYKMGKSMVWDVTVVDSYAATNINASAIKASSAAANAEEAKSLKYAALSQRYIFEGLAFVTSGELGPNAARVINEIGDMMRRSTGQFELISSSRYNREWFPSNSQAVSFNIFELILKTTILDIRAAAMTVVTLKHRNQTQIQQQQYLAYQGLTCQDSEYNRATLDYCEENPHQSSVTYPVVTSSDTKSSRATLRSECTFKGSSHSKVYSEVLTSFEFLMNSEVSSSNGDEAAFKEILIYQTLGQNTAQPNRVKFEASKMCSHQYVVNGSSGNGGHQQITHYQYSSS